MSAMGIHPPILYGGYVGFIVPFAFCVAALVTRRLGDGWIRSTRRWMRDHDNAIPGIRL